MYFKALFIIVLSNLVFNVKCTRTNDILSTLSKSDLLSKKVSLQKCCPEGTFFWPARRTCMKPNAKWRNISFDKIPIYHNTYNDWPKLTEKKFFDLFEYKGGILTNQKFNDTLIDYSNAHHIIHLTDNGTLVHIIPNEYYWLVEVNAENFCFDYKLISKTTHPQIIFLSSLGGDISEDTDPIIITIGFLVSSFFLALVLVVYCLLPELRNLSGLVLMAYVSSLFGAFFLMGIMRLRPYAVEVCFPFTYLTYFMFMSSFCWMTVMSCDIWWTFRGYAKARPIHRRGEMFKFGMYCCYSYGVPLALTILVVVMDFEDLRHKPWIVIPGTTKKGCFLSEDGKLLYLYMPMLILILSNWMFFLMTAFNIWRLHRNTAVLDSAAAGTPAAHRTQRYRLMVYLKLSVIMGINWVLEVASSYHPHFKGWYISDAYNLLVGFFIFLIFVCKCKIFRKLCKRLGLNTEWRLRRNPWNSRSLESGTSGSSQTSDSEVSQDTPLQVCKDPKGPVQGK